ncbi:MAG: hypothetical protein A2033_17365 [Bacteroidetes bacterium GWA2_31_9]|nr:MAG: hypothetical protein A2033_17365 [Bacteroidetes bacterium GWA2_31_9]
MTKKDFFILIIKLFGLMSIVTSLFSALPSSIIFLLKDIDFLSIILIVFIIGIVLGLFILLVFKADKLVQLLRLDKGFDDDKIEFGNINSKNIIKIGTFFIGGTLFIESIPAFISLTIFAFKDNLAGLDFGTTDKINWALSALNLIIGYMLITNLNFVAKLLNKDKQDKN